MILVSWQWRTPSKIYLMNDLIILDCRGTSISLRSLLKSILQNSCTNQMCVSVSTTSLSLTMLVWSSSCKIEISRRVVLGIPSLKFSIFVRLRATTSPVSLKIPLQTNPYAPQPIGCQASSYCLARSAEAICISLPGSTIKNNL